MANKWVYMFSEGDMTMRNLLGGKGANLAEMTSIGLPVPQGFTITTEACTQYYEDGRKINDEIMAQAMEGVKKMEEINGKKFGDLKNPLLVSVRSGARASMPGMMDTILNLGLNDEVVAAMIAGNPDPAFERFVYDSYRRFIQMFSDVVMEVGKKYFEQLIDKMKEERGVKFDIDLTAADLKELAEQFKAEYKNQLGTDFPSDPVEQLKLAIEAVFRSWDNPRANVYRRDNDIPYSWGTAVNVMPMVFGNLNNESGTGVAFTRDPATGENKLMGEFLINAQGEDVVAGVRTPMPIAQMEQEFPEAYAEFLKVCETLENHYHDMQDMEFTVENKKLYMLQCRNGKRTAPAALKIACDLVDEGHKTEEEAVLMIDPRNLDTLLHPQFDAAALKAATPGTKKALHDISAAVTKAVHWIINCAPFGILGLVYNTVSTNGLSIFTDYGKLLALLVGCMLFTVFVTNPIIVFSMLRRNPYPLILKCLKESGLTAFFTRSSAANIPMNMALCEKLGLNEDNYSVSIPLGSTINMDGAAITITVMSLAAAHTMGISVDIPTAIILSVLAAVSACGASGVAGGSLLLIPLACSLFGISNDVAMQVVGVGFIIGVVQDSVETCLNSSSDVLLTATAELYQRRKAGEDIVLIPNK